MYMCYFRVILADPNGFGAVQTVAQALANDLINPVAPAACTNNPADPWCFGVEGITQGCAKHPAQYIHYCTVPQPPPPIRTPMVNVYEAEKCDPAFKLTPEEELALLELVRPQAPGRVITMYGYECLSQQGDSFYQSTFLVSAGASLDVFGASAAIVNFINGQKSTLCTDPDPNKRPIWCKNPPLGGTNVCAVDQYDPSSVLICPRSPGNVAMSWALANCNCAATPGDTPEYKKNVLEWVDDITRTQNRVNVLNSVEEAKCVQRGTTCQYQYRVRSLPRDDLTDAYTAIQYVQQEVNARPMPCGEDAGFTYAFCVPGAYWAQAKACSQIWDRTNPIECTL